MLCMYFWVTICCLDLLWNAHLLDEQYSALRQHEEMEIIFTGVLCFLIRKGRNSQLRNSQASIYEKKFIGLQVISTTESL